jgi:hypothetical protein
VKGIRSGMVSMLAIFIRLRLKQVAKLAWRFSMSFTSGVGDNVHNVLMSFN